MILFGISVISNAGKPEKMARHALASRVEASFFIRLAHEIGFALVLDFLACWQAGWFVFHQVPTFIGIKI